MEKVYHSDSDELNPGFLNNLKQELKSNFSGCHTIAIKIHFGEPGNKTALWPEDVAPIIDAVKEAGFSYFMFDSPVVYNSPRGDVDQYMEEAEKKGWNKLGKIVISNDSIPVKGKHLTYNVCKPLAEADAVLVVTHFKGHVCSGFGGAIKNLGMGALSRETKGDIHDGAKPIFSGKCIQCKACADSCPVDGIEVTDSPHFNICFGCSNCAKVCPEHSINPKVAYFDTLLAEGAAAAQSKFKKQYYVSLMKRITQKCDCNRGNSDIIAKDAGFLMSKDGVAIDKAALDIITRNEGLNPFLKYNKKTSLDQIEEAERLGMGKKDYQLVTR